MTNNDIKHDEPEIEISPDDAARILVVLEFCDGFDDQELIKMGSLKNVKRVLKETKKKMAIRGVNLRSACRVIDAQNEAIQWHPYDKDNKGTHPPKEGPYAVVGSTFRDWARVYWDGEGWWWAGINYTGNVTKYQSITPPKE